MFELISALGHIHNIRIGVNRSAFAYVSSEAAAFYMLGHKFHIQIPSYRCALLNAPSANFVDQIFYHSVDICGLRSIHDALSEDRLNFEKMQ